MGKPVRGVAKCAPNDEFDINKGKELAAARCNLKVAQKRVKKANLEVDWLTERYYDLQDVLADYEDKIDWAVDIENEAQEELDRLIEEL